MPYVYDDTDDNLHVCDDCGAIVNSDNEPGGLITPDGEFHCADCADDDEGDA